MSYYVSRIISMTSFLQTAEQSDIKKPKWHEKVNKVDITPVLVIPEWFNRL